MKSHEPNRKNVIQVAGTRSILLSNKIGYCVYIYAEGTKGGGPHRPQTALWWLPEK